MSMHSPMFMQMRLRRSRDARNRRSPDIKRPASGNRTTSRGRFVKQIRIQCRSARRRRTREDVRRVRWFVPRDADAVVVLVADTRACCLSV